jgi:hypothetical protein
VSTKERDYFFEKGRLRPRSRPDRAIRSKSSDLPMQILRDFRCYPWRAQGLKEAVKAGAFSGLAPNKESQGGTQCSKKATE